MTDLSLSCRERIAAAMAKIAAVNSEIQGSRHEEIADALSEARDALKAQSTTAPAGRAYQPEPPAKLKAQGQSKINKGSQR